MTQPNLLFQPQFPLSKKDFSPEPLHQILFICIANIAKSGAEEITEVEIENFAKAYPAQLETLQDNNYFEFISTIKEICVLSNYELYYTSVRKFGLLRDLKEQGFDIKDYFDELQDEESQMAKLNNWTIQDILSDIELKGIKLRNKFDVRYTRDEMIAGENTQELIDSFKIAPAFGAFISSPYLTRLFMGWCKGHLIMDSSPSGVGKTRISVADLCGVSVDEMWDDEAQDFIPNLNYQGNGLFIHTELDEHREINPMFLACVAGVDVRNITLGKLSPEEEKRVIKAGEILLRNKLILCDMADFTAKGIDRKIKECIETYGTQYMVFDYVQLNSSLVAEYRQNTAVQAREDLVLKNLTLELKDMAQKYNIGIKTASQLNGVEKTLDFPDESCLSGGKSQKVKLDAASITLPVKDRLKEFKRIEPYLKRKGFGSDSLIKPNLISYVYKARFSDFADQKIKVWRYFDRSRFRNVDFFCTNQYDEIVKVPKPVLEENF